jgi:hypothetical protein
LTLGLRPGSPARVRLEKREAVEDRAREWVTARERVRKVLNGPYTSEWPRARAAEEAAAERLEQAIEELDS